MHVALLHFAVKEGETRTKEDRESARARRRKKRRISLVYAVVPVVATILFFFPLYACVCAAMAVNDRHTHTSRCIAAAISFFRRARICSRSFACTMQRNRKKRIKQATGLSACLFFDAVAVAVVVVADWLVRRKSRTSKKRLCFSLDGDVDDEARRQKQSKGTEKE
jgi:hypothetical protein